MRKNMVFFMLMLLSLSSLATQLVLFYLDEQFRPVVVREEIQRGSDVVKAIFDKLSSPPIGLKSFVPKDSLRAYFFVERYLVIDLKRTALATFDFTQERFFVHQLLRTIFENFPGIDAIYFLLDGSRGDVLVNMVDVRFGFARHFWARWPVEGE
ncbi:GerMN domain-containing protein [Pseudothermotoga sp.]|nr:GerMN domain-containing protein [Pseudothermotoga sp.]MDW8139346.1 GerMN domain-containing protein [Pseudothermotoga sp.]